MKCFYCSELHKQKALHFFMAKTKYYSDIATYKLIALCHIHKDNLSDKYYDQISEQEYLATLV